MVDFKALSAPFDAKAISWRVGAVAKDKKTAIALAYIDARDVMDRLDSVVGAAGWQCRYSHADAKTICEIGIKIGNDWVWKSDGAGDSDIEAQKGALSDAFKRAAVRWGIGRYLYDIKSVWVKIDEFKRIVSTEYKSLEDVARKAAKGVVFDQPEPVQTEDELIKEIKNMVEQAAKASAEDFLPIVKNMVKSWRGVKTEKGWAIVQEMCADTIHKTAELEPQKAKDGSEINIYAYVMSQVEETTKRINASKGE